MYRLNPLLEFRIPDIYVGHTVSALHGAMIGNLISDSIIFKREIKSFKKWLYNDENLINFLPQYEKDVKSTLIETKNWIRKSELYISKKPNNYEYNPDNDNYNLEILRKAKDLIKELSADYIIYTNAKSNKDYDIIKPIVFKLYACGYPFIAYNIPYKPSVFNRIIKTVMTIGGGVSGWVGYHTIKHPVESFKKIKKLVKR